MELTALSFFLTLACSFPHIALALEKNISLAKPTELIFTQKGNIPILLAVPHGGRLPIGDVKERQTGCKKADLQTLELVQLINKKLQEEWKIKPYIVAALFSRRYIDANRSAKRAYEEEQAQPVYDCYHKQIAQYIEELKQLPNFINHLLLDIHGQSTDHETTFRGTQDKKTVKLLIEKCGEDALSGPESIMGALAAQGQNIFPPASQVTQTEHSSYNGGFTVGTYGSHEVNGIDAIQLEFGRTLRAYENIDTTAKQMVLAIVAFHKKWQTISSE